MILGRIGERGLISRIEDPVNEQLLFRLAILEGNKFGISFEAIVHVCCATVLSRYIFNNLSFGFAQFEKSLLQAFQSGLCTKNGGCSWVNLGDDSARSYAYFNSNETSIIISNLLPQQVRLQFTTAARQWWLKKIVKKSRSSQWNT